MRTLLCLSLVFPLLACTQEVGPVQMDSEPDEVAELRQACLDFTNARRAELSLSALTHWDAQASCSDIQAAKDQAGAGPHGSFGDCGESAQNTCPGWPASADVESQKESLLGCLQSMWNEGPGEPYIDHGHYINMSNSHYTSVVCGFSYQNGRLWVNQNFH